MRRWKLGAGLLMMILVVVGSAGTAAAAPGDLDASFGSGGIVSSNAGSGADVALQPDGKIVVVGKQERCPLGPTEPCESEFLVERYEADGSLDNSFGSGGVVLTSFAGATEAAASSVIVESGGKILVGGEAGGKFALARYNNDGSLDNSFGGGDGKATAAGPNAGGTSESGTMVLLASGQIVLAGNANVPLGPSEWGEPSHMALARFNKDGTLDTTYGTNGIAIGPRGRIYGVAADGSGRVLVAGWSNYEFAVARFTAGGSLDTSFSGSGLVKMNLNETGSKAADVLVEPDGKILVSGYGEIGMAVMRFNEDGSLDPSFGGGDGIVTPSFSKPPVPCCVTGSAIALALEPDGRIVIAGQWHPLPDEVSANDEWAVARLYPNGVADKSFGTNGLVTNAFQGGGYGDYATGVALQEDGKIVVVGSSGSAVQPEDLGVMRFFGGGSAPQPADHRLTIQNADPEDGWVDGPELLYCGYNCAAEYEVGETVELRAEGEWQYPANPFTEEATQLPFSGWTTIAGNPGTCTGTTTPCEVTLSGNVALQAHFGESAVPEEPGGGGEAPAEEGGSGGSETPPSGGGEPGGGGSRLPSGTGGTQTDGSPSTSGASPTSPVNTAPQAAPEAGKTEPATLQGAAFVKKGRALLRLHCPTGGQACRGVLRLVVNLHQVKHSRHAKHPGGTAGRTLGRTKRIVIGKSHFRVAAGRKGTVHVELTGRGKSLVAKAGEHGLRVHVVGGGHRNRQVLLKGLVHGGR